MQTKQSTSKLIIGSFLGGFRVITTKEAKKKLTGMRLYIMATIAITLTSILFVYFAQSHIAFYLVVIAAIINPIVAMCMNWRAKKKSKIYQSPLR